MKNEDQKGLDPNWKKKISQMGKDTFQRQEMIKLGFWKPKGMDKDLVKKYQSHLDETFDLLSEKKKELTQLDKELEDINSIKELLSKIKAKRIKTSLESRKERKKETHEKKQLKLSLDRERRLIKPPFLGEGVSSRLKFSGEDIEKLNSLNLPVLKDLNDLSLLIDIEPAKISWLCFHQLASSCDHYHRFSIPKRTGKPRIISSPKPKLRKAQEAINREILSILTPEKEATAFIKKTNIKHNADLHANKGMVIRIDLSDFFFSITFKRVRGFFISLGYSPGIATVLGLLCTDSNRKKISYRGEDWYVAEGERRLPQGSPASPALSNLISRRMDRRIRNYLNKIDPDWTYSRYADDLAFSHPSKEIDITKVISCTNKIIPDEGFSINTKKTIIMRRPYRQMITGLILNDKDVRIPRSYLKKVRAMIHSADKLTKEGKVPENIEEIKGKLSFIRMIMPEQEKKLRKNNSWLYSLN